MLIFGWIGGVINALHVLPQVIKIFKTRSTKDISYYSLVIKLIAAITYTIHGIIIQDPPLLYMTGLMVVQYLFILGQYKYYYKVPECDANTVASDSLTTPIQTTQNDPRA
jgi:MtN3 and saliva related transmembrane protein